MKSYFVKIEVERPVLRSASGTPLVAPDVFSVNLEFKAPTDSVAKQVGEKKARSYVARHALNLLAWEVKEF